MVTKSEKRRAVMIDSLICVLLPVLVAVLSYIVQGHRYNVLEQLGCFPALYNTLLTYFLVNWWPLVLGSIASIYCLLSLFAFNQRRAQFNEFLTSNKGRSSLTLSRYFRLMALSTTSLLLLIPISSYGLYLNATAAPIEPWRSWADTHFDFGRIEQVPAIIWRARGRGSVVANELNRWLAPLCALVFFAYFGVASEARRHYAAAFSAVARRLGFKPKGHISEKKGLQVLAGKAGDGLPPPYTRRAAAFTNTTTTATVSVSSFPDADDKPFGGYQGLASIPPSPSSAASPASPSSAPAPATPIYNHFARSAHGAVPTPPPFACALGFAPPAQSLPVSPTDSMFSHDSAQSAVSLSFTDIEAAYGARVPSFVERALEVEVEGEGASEPPTPHRASHWSAV